MNDESSRDETLFHEAMQLPTPEARAAYLNDHCGSDEQLRQRVEALIRAAEQAGDFLEHPAAGAPTFLSASPADKPSPQPTIVLTVPIAEKPGDRIGHYKLLEQIGEGGCGVVYMAEQTEPIRRRVALKVIKLGMDTKSVVARFEAERQALALMDHPHIARVLDAGATDTGRPYFVMELVRGIKLTDYCDQNHLSTKERLDLFMQVCQAVQHAHQKGIIHRDLKPSNILVTLHDGVPVPKVIDFGIAKATQQPLTDKTLFTAYQQFIGTPAYMSPEQAELSGLDIDTRSDIYSLGVLLYELLVGKPPFDPETLLKAGFDEMRRIIRETEPPKPSTKLATIRSTAPHSALRVPQWKEVRGDLDWIVMKCLEKDRGRRYETATGLAHDIERHLNNEPVTAGAPGAAYRMSKFIRRHRYGFATATAIVLLLVAGVVVSTWQAARARRAERAAHLAGQAEAAHRRLAEASAAESRERLGRLDLANGIRAMEEGDAFGSLLWFTEALGLERTNSPSDTTHRLRIGTTLAYAPQLAQMWFHDEPVNQAVFSPDGSRVLTVAEDCTARVWNAVTGEPLTAPLRHAQPVTLAVFSPDGHRLATACADRTARVWDVRAASPLTSALPHEGHLAYLQFTPDGEQLYTVASRGNWYDRAPTPAGRAARAEVRLWTAANGQEARRPMRLSAPVESVAMSADGEWIALGGEDGTVNAWHVRTGDGVHFARGGTDGILVRPSSTNAASSPTEEALARAWEPFLGVGAACERWDAAVLSVAFSPDARQLAAGCVDGAARIWDLETGRRLLTLKHVEVESPSPYKGGVRAAFSPDGQQILTVGPDCVVKFWNTRPGEFTGQLLQPSPDAVTAVFSPDGRWVATANGLTGLSAKADAMGHTPNPPEVRLWNARTGEPVASPLPHAGRVTSFAFSPDAAGLLTASTDQAARLWKLAGAHAAAPRVTHTRLTEASRTNVVTAPDLAYAFSGRDRASLERRTRLMDTALTGDGRRLVTVCANGTARVWDAKQVEPLSPILQMNAALKEVRFNWDESRFVTLGHRTIGAEDGVACIWDAATFQPVTPVICFPNCGCTGDDLGAEFSPDGRWLAIRSHAEVFLFNAQTGQPENWPMKLNAPVITCDFSPNSNSVALYTGFRDPVAGTVSRGEVRIWDLRTGQPITPPLDAGQLGPLATGRVNERGQTNFAWLHTGHIGDMQFSPDGRWLVTGGMDSNLTPAQMWSGRFTRVQLWDATTGQAKSPALWPETYWCNEFFTPDSAQLYVLNSRKVVHLWNTAAGKALAPPALNLKNQDLYWSSSDGQLLISKRGPAVRLWDALTGEPATPTLVDWSGRGADIRLAMFARNSWALLVRGDDWVEFWPLPVDRRPLDVLTATAQLLAARRLDASGAMDPLSPAELRQLWQRVRAGQPGSAGDTTSRLSKWHGRAVEACERDKQWFAAAFHLERLTKAQPDDESLRRRLARARDEAALTTLKLSQ